MQVNLEQIVASDKPIRTTWSEEEMQQLVESIKQWGVIQAVKLRPLGGAEPCKTHGYEFNFDCLRCDSIEDELRLNNAILEPFGYPMWAFEIVDGHRRIEASRRAGLEYIEATIEGMDDQTALIQSLIANVHREGNTPIDTGNALRAIKEQTGWVDAEIARQCSKSHDWVMNHLALVEKDDIAIQSKLYPGRSDDKQLSEHHARAIRKVEIPVEEKVQILEKAQEEDLGWAKTGRIAEAVKVADDYGDNEAKAALLEREYSPTYHDPERVRDHLQGAKEDNRKSMSYTTKPPAMPQVVDEWEVLDEAADVMDGINDLINRVPNFVQVAEIGKLSPEGQRFLSRRIGILIVALSNFQTKIDNGEYDNG
jgi:ParB/RepB/Spo0J family partition protein